MTTSSHKVRYVLQALVDLALHQEIGPVTVKAIAKRQKIPLRYLEQLFHRLRQEGLVAAERGPRGGYRLSTSPESISMSSLLESLESEKKKETSTPAAPRADPAALLLRQIEGAIQNTLQTVTLGQLVSKAREQEPGAPAHSFTFHI